jgi:hypothetical protein
MEVRKKRKLSEDLEKWRVKRKSKRRELLPDQLQWKEVRRPKEAGLDDFEGMLMLEEVDNVEVIYGETAHGKIAKFVVSGLVVYGLGYEQKTRTGQRPTSATERDRD